MKEQGQGWWNEARVGSVLAIALLMAVSAQAQTRSRAQTARDDTHASLMLTGGASVMPETGGTLGGEGTVRLSRLIDVIVDGTRLWDITPDAVSTPAWTIATAVDATATTTVRAGVFDAGLRIRLPGLAASRVQPYVLAGGGAAHVRIETAFARNGTASPDALGIELGRDLSGATTKPVLLVGGGALVPFARRAFFDLALRYDRIFARPSEIPNDRNLNSIRFQIGAGVRF